jgi:ribosome-associated heat shock protein Hsp15
MAEAPKETGTDCMRLDLFLWYVRLAKTRAVAQTLAATGRMRLDGRLIERAHCPVRVGNVLTFAQGQRVRTLRVEALPSRRGPAPEAQGCYTDLGATPAPPHPGPPPANVSQQAGG